MEYYFGAGSSNCGQLGPNLAIPTHRFDHPILVILNVTALGPIVIIIRLIRLENEPVLDSTSGSSGSSNQGSS